MPTFLFTARDGAGSQSSGSMIADSVAAAVDTLRSEGKYPTSVRPAEQAARRKRVFDFGPRLTRKDLLQFATQLQMMMETGVPLSEALESIAAQSHKPSVRAVITELAVNVQGGTSLSGAMAKDRRSFPRLLLALVAASEKSGMMAKMLGRAVTYLRDEQDIVRRVRGALTYPAIMLVFALSATCFLMTFVLPKFTAIYAAKGASLPLLTQCLMSVSAFLVNDWYWLVLGVVAAAVAIWRFLLTPSGWRTYNRIQLHLPLFGSLFQKLHLSRGLRMIGTMAGAGINLPDCVHTAADLCPNIYFRDLWDRVSSQIQAGKQFSQPLFESKLVPKSVAQMLHSAEKAGKLALVMEQVATFAENELKLQIVEMTRYIEPAMIVIMGGIIGTVALALMLPIFTISKVIAK